MRFDDDDLEVYLKPHGKEFEARRFREKPVTSIHGPRRKTCEIFVTEQLFEVVVRFGNDFRMYSAGCVKAIVRFGRGQPDHSLDDAHPLFIRKSKVCGQQHVVSHVELSRTGASQEDMKQWPLKLKAHKGFKNTASTFDKNAQPGTITVLITRGGADLMDGLENDFEEIDPSEDLLFNPGSFDRISSVNGEDYLFEFRRSPLASAKDSDADSLDAGFVSEPDDAFVPGQTETERIRADLTKSWRERQARRQHPLANGVHVDNCKSAAYTTPKKAAKSASRRQAKFCTCGAHSAPTPTQERGPDCRTSRSAGQATDNEDETEQCDPYMPGSHQPTQLNVLDVLACPTCHGAKVTKRQRKAFKPQLQDWCSQGERQKEGVSRRKLFDDDEDDEEPPTIERPDTACRAVCLKPEVGAPTFDNDFAVKTKADLRKSVRLDETKEALFTGPVDVRRAEEPSDNTAVANHGMPTPGTKQTESSNAVSNAPSNLTAGDDRSPSALQDSAAHGAHFATAPPTQSRKNKLSRNARNSRVPDDTEIVDLYADDGPHRPPASTFAEIKHEGSKREGVAVETPSANGQTLRSSAQAPSVATSSSGKRAASTELQDSLRKQRCEPIEEHDVEMLQQARHGVKTARLAIEKAEAMKRLSDSTVEKAEAKERQSEKAVEVIEAKERLSEALWKVEVDERKIRARNLLKGEEMAGQEG